MLVGVQALATMVSALQRRLVRLQASVVVSASLQAIALVALAGLQTMKLRLLLLDLQASRWPRVVSPLRMLAAPRAIA